jgi:hypothetical protein
MKPRVMDSRLYHTHNYNFHAKMRLIAHAKKNTELALMIKNIVPSSAKTSFAQS